MIRKVRNRDGSESWAVDLYLADPAHPGKPPRRVQRRLPSSASMREVQLFQADLIRAANAGTLADWLAKYDGRCRAGTRRQVVPGRPRTVRELCEAWAEAQAPRWKPSHATNVASILRCWVFPAFGDRTVDDVGLGDIERWVREMRAAGSAQASINARLHAVSGAWRWASDPRRGWVATNPAAGLVLPNHAPKQRRDSLTDAELARVLDLAEGTGHPLDTMVPVLAWTGIRVGEAVCIEAGDYDPRTRELHVQRAWSRGTVLTTKGGDARLVPLDPRAEVPILRRIAEVKAGPLWPNPDTVAGCYDPKGISEGIADLMRQTGMDEDRRRQLGAAHALRHTWATRLANAGVDEDRIRILLGHKSATTTRGYIHRSADSLRDAVRSLA